MNVAFWLALLVMIIGLAGTVLPVLPGIPLIFVAILGYAFYIHFTLLKIWFILIMGLLTAVSLGVDYLSSVYGAKRYGASRVGIWGAVIGGVLGLVFLPPIGIVVGPLLGAVVGELMGGKRVEHALSIGWGTFVGMLGGAVLKIVIGLIMILAFVFKAV